MSLTTNSVSNYEFVRHPPVSWRQYLDEAPFVAQWLEGRPKSTQQHRSVYVQHFTERTGVAPEQFVALPVKEARRVAWKFIEPMSRRYPAKALGVRAALQSLYRYGTGGDILTFDSGRGGAHYIRYVRNGNKLIPTKQQIYRIADCAGSLKGTAMVLMLFQSGVRPGALCGLNYGDVRKQLEGGKVPLRLRITPAIDTKLLSYELDYYMTWVQGEAVQALRAWVDYVMEHTGWKDDTPLFHSCHGNRYHSSDLYYRFRRSLTKAGLTPARMTLYGLRKRFYNVLLQTPMDDPNFKEALMGHKLQGSRGNYFDYHDVEQLEREYMRADFSRGIAKREITILREQLKDYELALETQRFLAQPHVMQWLEQKMREDGLLKPR